MEEHTWSRYFVSAMDRADKWYIKRDERISWARREADAMLTEHQQRWEKRKDDGG